MNSEKEFKDTLKEKLDAKEFQFDEANWLKASGMLDATREEKKRRPFPYFLVSGILVLITIGGFVIYKFSDTTTGKLIAVSNTNSQAQETRSVSNVTTLPEQQNKKVNAIEEKVNNETKVVNERTKTVTQKENAEVINVTEKAISGNNAKKEKINTTTNPVRTTKQKQRNSTAVKNTIVVTPKQEKENKSKSKQNNMPAENPANTFTPAIAGNETPVNTNPVVSEPKSVENEVTVATSNITAVDSVKSSVAVAEPVKRDSTLKLKEPINFISFEAGASYLFGWNNPGKRDANGVNPIVGLNYSNTLNTPFVFSLGLHYTMVRNLSYGNHVVTTTRYNFGEETDVMVFTPTTMHYLLAPIKFGYISKEKNVFGIGYNAAYLFNLNSNVELYAQTSGQKGKSTVLKTSGYTQGFKKLDSQMSLFYRRKLGKDLWINTEFIYGLTDIKDNTFFNSNVFERNMGVKMTLIYNLFKK